MSRRFLFSQAIVQFLLILNLGIPRLCATLQIVSVDPPAGTVEALGSIMVTFSAPVSGAARLIF